MKYLILVVLCIFVSPCQMKEAYNIKLIGSSLQYAGQVQISISGSQWKSICADGWDIKDARVVCRQLNYLAAEAAILGEAFGHAPGEVDKKKFNCFGNESSLSQCPTENTKCSRNNVAAVLCKPNDNLSPVYILISLVGCLALTSIVILIITWKAMIAGKKRCPAKEREIGLSNANIERDIEVCSSTEGKREWNGSGETFSSGSYSNFENVENISYPVDSVNTKHKKKENPNSVSNAELIESISSLEARHSDIDQEGIKRKESRKGKYMSLLKGSRAFLQFYEKLLKRNKGRQSATDIDYALDYYSSDQYSKDWQGNNINDIDISSDEEYHEIDPEEEQDQEKVDKDKNGSEYVPMLSLTLMHCSREHSVNEETQEEYLDILPPGAVGKEKSFSGSSKRDSDYLQPVQADLPSFPETSDNISSCSYDEELPQPPQDLANNNQNDIKRYSPSGSLGLSHQRCRCEKEKDLMCKNCLDSHVKKNIGNQELDDELEYVPMDHCMSGEKDNTTNLRRNSADYTIPIKSALKNKKEHGSFPEELNKNKLNRKSKNDTFQSYDKELFPNKKEKFNPASKGVMKEKGYEGLRSPRNARKQEEKRPHPEKTVKADVTATPSFSRTKDFFENNKTVANSLDKTKKKAAFSKRAFNSEESESTGIPIPTSSNAGKPRSESCPVDATNGAKPSTSFIAALENALKAREGTEGISERDENEMEITENEYELDYEDIHSSPDESKYENNDISSGSRPGSYEYDYVHEKHRNSLHFYEAVSKQSEESEEDQYEKI